MSELACEVCKKSGSLDEFALCRRDHPVAVNKLLSKQGEEVEVLNRTGKTIPFKDLDSTCLNKLIIIQAKIMQVSDISNYDIQRTFECKCGFSVTKNASEFRDIYDKESFECPECEENMMYLDKKQTITGNIRKVVLQETMDESGINPRRMEAHLTSKDVFVVEAGKDYKIEAELWSITYGKKENYNRFVLDVRRIRCLDEKMDEMPDYSEIEMFKSKDKKLVVESLAPAIVYRSNEKMALLISYLSGDRIDGVRGDISVMLIGDPATAKSDLLDAIHELDLKSFKISGRSSSAAGMVMGVDNLPDGTRMATFGPVILAHKHFVCIDEGDKMNASDQSMLHDVMESEVAHLNKVGINMSIKAETKIIMAANPKSSKYEEKATIMANIGMPYSFISRFGYVFLVLDNFPIEMERIKLHRINEIKMNGLNSVIEKENFLTQNQLRKYLNYAKTFHPKFSPSSLSKLEDLYVDLKYREQKKGSIAIDTRAYHDIIRASYGFARFRFSDVVEIEDVNNAWKLYLESLKSFGMVTQGEMKEVQFATRDNTRQQWINECLESCNVSGMINIETFKLKLMESPNMFRNLNSVDITINDLTNEGRILKTGIQGVYKYNG